MPHPQQDQCARTLRALAHTSDLRVVDRHGNCYFFVSDHGAQILKDDFGIEAAVADNLQQVFKEYALGKTSHHIPRESLTGIVGKFGLSDALRGEVSYISKQPATPIKGRV